MSFVTNDASVQQLSLIDPYDTLSEREKRFPDWRLDYQGIYESVG